MNIWIIFVIGFALGLVIGNKTLREKTLAFIRGLGQKKSEPKETTENKCLTCKYFQQCKNSQNPKCPYFSTFPRN